MSAITLNHKLILLAITIIAAKAGFSDSLTSANVVGYNTVKVHQGYQTVTNLFSDLDSKKTLGEFLPSVEEQDQIQLRKNDLPIITAAVDVGIDGNLHWFDVMTGKIVDNVALSDYDPILEYVRTSAKQSTLNLSGAVGRCLHRPDAGTTLLNQGTSAGEITLPSSIPINQPFVLRMKDGATIPVVINSDHKIVRQHSRAPVKNSIFEIQDLVPAPTNTSNAMDEESIGAAAHCLKVATLRAFLRAIPGRLWLACTGCEFDKREWPLAIVFMFILVLIANAANYVVMRFWALILWLIRKAWQCCATIRRASRGKHRKIRKASKVIRSSLLTLSITLAWQGNSEAATSQDTIEHALSKSTVRLECGRFNTNVVKRGTAFIVSLHVDRAANTWVPILVTNKHVIDESQFVRFIFSKPHERGRIPEKIPVVYPTSLWIGHPDANVDLCAMPLAPILREAESKGLSIDFSPLPVDIISMTEDLRKLRQLDEVVMVGYPDGIIDSVFNQPIFRKGVMATDPFLDYMGRPEFLVDIATYSGSSGSPVFSIRGSTWIDRDTGRINFATGGASCKLLGILYASHMHDVTGRPIPTPIPTSTDIKNPWIPNNLGIVIKAEKLLDFKQLIKSR